MKKFLMLSIVLFAFSNLFAQTEKPNRIGINFGYGIPLSTGTTTSLKNKAGVNISLDYGRAMSDNFELGLEINRSIALENEKILEKEASTIGEGGSYFVKGRYFLTGNTYNGLYAGLGLGLGNAVYSTFYDKEVYQIVTKLNFAFATEIGYRYKWINFGVKYINIGGSTNEKLGNGVTLNYKLPRYQDLQFALGANIPF